ncbi:branched-chain amino acid ABC transporter substrate-binding protein [Peribacillus acanthi]|uniref:branched-chain amino acid ABC transporter substrate-binding protein n=1 Tax=Peribacillus acanthi TaxID=2171554 RepID=UPI0023E7ABDF|nr:branched-chain amino acid ABC transporter substrate-binding protein [Peribacillus acanthi]
MVISLVSSTLYGCSIITNQDKQKIIKIATQTPLTGGSAEMGQAIRMGAQLALDQNKSKFEKLGYKIELVVYDDQSNPKKGVANAKLIGNDSKIYAVVGHLNSDVAIPSSEVYEKYHVAMVSPANTVVEVTERGFQTVNRIVGRDDLQGFAAGAFAVERLSAKKIFILHEESLYGEGLAKAFQTITQHAGAKIVNFIEIPKNKKDFKEELQLIIDSNPDLIYFGGFYSQGGLIIKQAREKGIKTPFMGGDGLDSSALVEMTKEAVKDTYLTSIAGDLTINDLGKKFQKDYHDAFGIIPDSVSVNGYDAMRVILNGIEEAIKSNENKLPTREQVMHSIRNTKDFEGVLTKVSFDHKGDNKYASFYMYHFKEAKYPPELIEEVNYKQ